jgi:GntR family transcriptional repressor for pyruvate dehydrogenase complex
MAIAYATNNPLQVFIMKNFYDYLFTGIKVNLEGLYKVPGNIDTILDQHKAIFKAIRAHNPEAAYRAMKRHIDFVYDFFDGARVNRSNQTEGHPFGMPLFSCIHTCLFGL